MLTGMKKCRNLHFLLPHGAQPTLTSNNIKMLKIKFLCPFCVLRYRWGVAGMDVTPTESFTCYFIFYLLRLYQIWKVQIWNFSFIRPAECSCFKFSRKFLARASKKSWITELAGWVTIARRTLNYVTCEHVLYSVYSVQPMPWENVPN
jgi:hypothetical protein